MQRFGDSVPKVFYIGGVRMGYVLITGIFIAGAAVFYILAEKKRQEKEGEIYQDFLRMNEEREERHKKELQKQEAEFQRREDILTAENLRREELILGEAEKRERILKEEAAKREQALLNSIESFSGTMREISEAMSEIKRETAQIREKVGHGAACGGFPS